MKVRESGMPGPEMWHTFFDPVAILDSMGLTNRVVNAVDFGCGYGTFAIPAAKQIQGTLYGFDLEPAMIAASERFAANENVRNIQLYQRDFVNEGTGMDTASVDYVMLFNILHAEDPLCLLREAYRILSPAGNLGVIHWNYDPKTPRGPPMSMRPKPEDCRQWIEETGFIIERAHIDLPPHHYGLLARK